MKTRNTIPARFLCLIVISGSVFLFACKNTRQGVKEDFQDTREEVQDVSAKSDEQITAEKKSLYTKIEEKKEEINAHIRQLQEDARQDGNTVENVIKQLEMEKERLDLQLNLMESAANETWTRTKNDMEGILQDVAQTVDNLIAGLEG